ncbi:MAG: hypothetical protein PHQ56_02530 [Dysgonamonadaceae bacterium]|nr:hypothetical protein [Dysgonamonadaceae bacterium]MDD3355750.1 hypothetical protein [Dysgonamonadaceae bacterium]
MIQSTLLREVMTMAHCDKKVTMPNIFPPAVVDGMSIIDLSPF